MFVGFNDLMKGLEREEIKKELLRDWYRQRTKTFTQEQVKLTRNN